MSKPPKRDERRKTRENKRYPFKLIPILFLSGCSLMIGNYDPLEYGLVNRIRTEAQVSDCSKQSTYVIYVSALELKNYSQYLPNNDQEIALVDDLYKIVDQLYTFKSPSAAYCKAKLNIIETTAERIQQVTGSKPR